MKITQLETLRLGEFPNLVWVRVHTDQGVVGLARPAMPRRASRLTCTNMWRRA